MERLSILLEKAALALAAVSLFAIMALTFFDVLGRKFLSHSITGSLELTELLMVAVIFGALPSVARRSEHVKFDSLDAVLPAWVRKIQTVLVALVTGVLMAAVAWLMWKTGGEFLQSGETTAQLRILKAPFVYAMSVLCAITSLMHFASLLHRQDGDEESPEGTVL